MEFVVTTHVAKIMLYLLCLSVFGRPRERIRAAAGETAAKIADALAVTLDYLVKDGEYKNVDNEGLKRLQLMEKLPKEERNHLFATMDAFFAKHKLQSLLK